MLTVFEGRFPRSRNDESPALREGLIRGAENDEAPALREGLRPTSEATSAC